MMRLISTPGASLGRDHGSAVSTRYRAPYPFTGTLHDVEIVLGSRSSGDEAAGTRATATTEMSRQ